MGMWGTRFSYCPRTFTLHMHCLPKADVSFCHNKITAVPGFYSGDKPALRNWPKYSELVCFLQRESDSNLDCYTPSRCIFYITFHLFAASYVDGARKALHPSVVHGAAGCQNSKLNSYLLLVGNDLSASVVIGSWLDRLLCFGLDTLCVTLMVWCNLCYSELSSRSAFGNDILYNAVFYCECCWL